MGFTQFIGGTLRLGMEGGSASDSLDPRTYADSIPISYGYQIWNGLVEIDEKGNAFYIVRVRTSRASFDEKLPILPGMTAEVDILTGRKTVLSYLLKPVLKVKSYALRER